MAHLSADSYGKQRVRLTKVTRGTDPEHPEHHDVQEYTVEIMLHGAFGEVYTVGDNAACVPTDTMKNTVYAVARLTPFHAPETFGLALTDRFITRFPQVESVDVHITAERRRRIQIDGTPHPYAFVKTLTKRTAAVHRARTQAEHANRAGEPTATRVRVEGGLTGMEVFKSSGSGFSGFFRDEYTTLAETEDRILATSVDAAWVFSETSAGGDGSDGDRGGGGSDGSLDYNGAWHTCEQTILEVFAGHQSPSLQATLYRMGETILERVPTIASVRFSMPNQHHIAFDLTALGLDNPDEIFYGTDSPYGIITGEVSRDGIVSADEVVTASDKSTHVGTVAGESADTGRTGS